MRFCVRTVSEPEFWAAFARLGGVYFIRDSTANAMKIGYTRDDPRIRLSNLQVGNPHRLTLAGCIAGEQSFEASIHAQRREWRLAGEWFREADATLDWLEEMTRAQPLFSAVWEREKSAYVIADWDISDDRPTSHSWDDDERCWVPPLPRFAR
jgi:hypothetical protein